LFCAHQRLRLHRVPYRKIKNARVVDYVTVVHAGDSEYKVNDHIEKNEIEKINAT